MKPSLALIATVSILVAAAFASSRLLAAPASSSLSTKASCHLQSLPPAAPALQNTLWGHIKSLARKSGRFEMRFDPALLLHGVTANRAAAEDGREVTNDYYIVDETHRLLTYIVTATARVTILTKGPCSTGITVSELAQILKGKNPKHRRLFGQPSTSGFWIRVGNKYPNPALSLDQQYQP